MRLFSVRLVSVGFAVGCGAGSSVAELVPTPGNYVARLDLLVGKSVNVAVAVFGSPTSTVDLAQGSKLHVWDDKSELRTPITGTEYHDYRNNADHIVIQPSQRIPLDCRTEMETDASGVFTRHRTEGAACMSLPPDDAFRSAVTAARASLPAPAVTAANAPVPVATDAAAAPAPAVLPAPVPTSPFPAGVGGGTEGASAGADAANARKATRAASTREERRARREASRDGRNE